jgi:hypothetical protein
VDDAFPFDPSESVDTDGDNIGNNADLDDDGYGFSDFVEINNGSDPLLASSIPTNKELKDVPKNAPKDDNSLFGAFGMPSIFFTFGLAFMSLFRRGKARAKK